MNHYTLEPTNEQGYCILNPQAIASKLTPCYNETKCNGNKAYTCPTDPRLFDAARGFAVAIDSPPISVTQCTAGDTTNYGKGYSNYNDINAGQITYYIDKSIKDPYYHPIFYNVAATERTMDIDPMDRRSVVYPRIPVYCRENEMCLSAVTDISELREQLMALQMRPRNRERYTINHM